MHTLILKPIFRKKAFQHHSWRKLIFWKNSVEMPNLAWPAQKSVTVLSWCKLFDVLSAQWYIKFYDVSSFSSAVLLLHDWTWSSCTTPVTCLWMRSPETRLAATWKDSRWRCEEDLHDFKKKRKKRVDRTSAKPKGKFFMEFTLSSKYSRKCKIFNRDYKQGAWLKPWQTWTEVMYKARQIFCVDLFLLVA